LVDKITSPNIIKLDNHKEILQFISGYGEISFILYDNKNVNINDIHYSCVNQIAEESYKPDIYFGYVNMKETNTTTVSSNVKQLKVINKYKYLILNLLNNIHIACWKKY